MPSTTPTSPSSRKIATNATSSASPEPASAGGRVLVAIGGGTGLSALLRGLKHHVGSHRLCRLVGVVTVTDDGGSSGRLRKELGVPPPGDVRNCIAALADDEDLLTRLFQYRFPNGGGLLGHSFGNLFLTALTGITGDFHQAILTAESVLSVRGKIFPATLTDVRLRGRGVSGRVYEGESAIGLSGEELSAIELDPAAPPAFPQAVAALERADLILLGPGSLYTSILPNLLIPGIRQAVAKAKAPVVLLLNLMTQPGETDGMMGADHLRALVRHAGTGLIDAVLINSAPIPEPLIRHYAETGSEPVRVDRTALEELGAEIVEADLLAEGDLIRHDSLKLAEAVLGLGRPGTPHPSPLFP
ncbi:MAG TPA: uridine diphosphate-N-acetylglucosamine-binding protein YvcK [Thermoanaerobaculia bacterium]|nr:uridine diphosphate-N-acetylglucosamine-binding protein YvcK [Thermoanaerobaculia bacterium]